MKKEIDKPITVTIMITKFGEIKRNVNITLVIHLRKMY